MISQCAETKPLYGWDCWMPVSAMALQLVETSSSYEFAKTELTAMMSEQKKADELDRERSTTTSAGTTKPEPPQKQEVLDALKDVAAAAQVVVGSSIQSALSGIGAKPPRAPTSTEVSSGQRWLFLKLCEGKMPPRFVQKIRELAGKGDAYSPTLLEDARRAVDALPGMDAVPALKDLDTLQSSEKEDVALGRAFRSQSGYIEWDWAWWASHTRDAGLYRVDDAGLAAKTERLWTAWQEYAAKATEGDALLEGQQLASVAERKQGEATFAEQTGDEIRSWRYRLSSRAARGPSSAPRRASRLLQIRSIPGSAPGRAARASHESSAPATGWDVRTRHVVAMNGGSLAVPLSPAREVLA